METKICTKCKIKKPISEFYKSKAGKYGVVSWCKKCCIEYAVKHNQRPERKQYYREYLKVYRQKPEVKKRQKEFRQSKKGRLSNRHSTVKCNYNITLEQYNKILKAQKECCAICNRHQSEFTRHLSIDHNHKTGVIRGLLCSKCNYGIGQFNDDVELLQRVITYLNKQ